MSSTLRAASIATAMACGFLGCSGTTGSDSTGTSAGSAAANSSGGSSTGGGTTGGTSAGTGTTGRGDTWTSWASPDFFKLYCISCHVAGGEGDPSGSNLDWTSYADVQMNANDIRCGVALSQDPSWNCPSSIAARQFPIGNGPKPADLDRIRLVSWIDAGLPQ